jgi:S-adenosylmethionine hydrolase
MAITTLLSDFGHQDASIAIAKGVLMQYVQPHQVADISHEITPFQLQQAAYVLGSAYRSFPVGTIHVLLFDIFSEPAPALILSEYQGHYFLAPDNGLLPLAIGDVPVESWLCFELTKDHQFIDWMNAVGNIVKQLSSKSVQQLQLPAYQLKRIGKHRGSMHSESFECSILHIDHYENVVVDVRKEQFTTTIGNDRSFRLEFMQVEQITAISEHYQDVRAGYKLCRFNSNGYLEICINKGKAASLFGLKKGGRHNNIKLIFE